MISPRVIFPVGYLIFQILTILTEVANVLLSAAVSTE